MSPVFRLQEELGNNAGNKEKKDIKIIEDEKRAQQIADDIKKMLTKIPRSSQFLGEKIDFQQKSNKKLFSKTKQPNLSELREEVIRSVEKKEISSPRKKIKKLIKKYPVSSDLRVLNGIQIFNRSTRKSLYYQD